MAVKYVDIEYLRAQNANAGQLILAGSSNTLTYTQYVTVDTNGNVGIGTTLPSSTLTVNGNIALLGNESVIIFGDGTTQDSAAVAYPSYGNPGTIQFAGTSNVFAGDSGNLFWDSANVRIGIGTSLPVSSMQVKYTAYESNSTSFSGTSLVVIDAFPASKVRSAQYFVQVTDETNSKYHTTQITVVQDGIMSYKSEYGVVTNGEKLGDFDSRISSGQLQLTFTAYEDTPKTVKITRTSMTA